MTGPYCVELCAGGGGQALGLEQAGFRHTGLFEIDANACATLRWNRSDWEVAQCDIRELDGSSFRGIDLLAGGLPCPPFSVAGKQLGRADERDLFPAAVRLIDESRPRCVMIENVRGLLDTRFEQYRESILRRLKKLGYRAGWRLLDACDYGVSQYRKRAILVAIEKSISNRFDWPEPINKMPPTVGEMLYGEMSSRGWRRADEWRLGANDLAPTIVGGSLKHGGPDLGPVRARKAWAALGVDGKGVADQPPEPDFAQMPRLTVPMVSKLQSFPDSWTFVGNKTPAYKQVGNAFPPPVARAVGLQIISALTASNPVQVGSWAASQ